MPDIGMRAKLNALLANNVFADIAVVGEGGGWVEGAVATHAVATYRNIINFDNTSINNDNYVNLMLKIKDLSLNFAFFLKF
jgi:hypothetical protein